MPNKLAVAGPDSKFQVPDAEPAGFWPGVWHGSILPITFVVSLFKPGVGIYETHNNGGWYNFGFLLGAASALGGKTININRPCPGAPDDEAQDEADE